MRTGDGGSSGHRPSERLPGKGHGPRVRHPSEVRQGFAGGGAQGVTFGVLPVLEMLRANARRIEKIVVADGVREKRLQDVFELARTNGVRVDRVPRETLERLVSEGANHQGIVAFAAAADYVEPEVIYESMRDSAPLIVILDGIEDPPTGLEDVSKLPILTEELLRRGHSEAVVRGVLGENFLAMWE